MHRVSRAVAFTWVGLWLAASGCRCAEQAPFSTQAERMPPQRPIPASEVAAAWKPLPPSAANAANAFVWWEAEAPRATNFPKAHSFTPDTPKQAALLSNGDWLGTDNSDPSLFIEYDVDVPAIAGAKAPQAFDFFARKFWLHGPFRWRFDEQPWQHCTREVHILGSTTLRPNVAASWVFLGRPELNPGKHRLRIELTEAGGPAVFDAFVLSGGAFQPRGPLKPGDPYPEAPAGWSNFDPAPDSFAPSALDLRSLNQVQAGADGFVKAKGSELVFEKTQQPVRFWGVNTGPDVLALSPELMQRYARHLAKFGVNLVRFHGSVFRAEAFREVDIERVTALQQLAKALRAEGVYLGLSIYFPAWLRLEPKDNVAGYTGQNPFGLSYFNEDVERAEQGWWRELLTRPNPLGVPLAQDATLAYVELLNEDSTLFWTFRPYDALPEAQTILLEQRFGRWLATKYGTLDQAFSAWGGAGIRGDDAAGGRAGFVGLETMVRHAPKRARDTAEFLTRSMRDHYVRLQTFIKGELGYPGLTVCSNWQTANEPVLGPLDNWANSACDVMDRHAYSSGPHEGDGSAYSVRPGHQFDDRSALMVPATKSNESLLPAFLEPRYNGKPAFVSELSWSWPNRFRAEGPLLVAMYGRSTGIDAPMWFVSSQPFWASALDKFEIKEPSIFGQFPAAAAIFRSSALSESSPSAELQLTEQSLFTLDGVAIAQASGLDAFRAKDVPAGAMANGNSTTDPFALLRGPIDVWLGMPPAPATAAPPLASTAQSEGAKAGVIQSRNQQLSWDFAAGIAQLNAPGANAAVGFLGRKGRIDLTSMSVSLVNDYATVALVALDGATLDQSRRMLLQVMSEVTNMGWQAPGQGLRPIVDTGAAPILTREIQGIVTLRRADAATLKVTALDASGQPTQIWQKSEAGIVLLPSTLYYLLEAP